MSVQRFLSKLMTQFDSDVCSIDHGFRHIACISLYAIVKISVLNGYSRDKGAHVSW